MSSKQVAKNLSAYLRRSWRYAKDKCLDSVRMDASWKREMPMFYLDSVDNLQQWTVGCDADIGGLSEAYWGLTPNRTGLLWGTISTDLPPDSKLKVSGYAGIKSKERPLTLLHKPRFDVTEFRYLGIRAKGDTRQWFVNIQCDSIYPSYLWQHRLHFQRPGEWETIMVPFRDFVLTAYGFVQRRQLDLDRSNVKSVGFSLVRQPGDFNLELEWIKAMNTEGTFGDLDLKDDMFSKKIKGENVPLIESVKKAKEKLEIPSSIKLLPDKNDRNWF